MTDAGTTSGGDRNIGGIFLVVAGLALGLGLIWMTFGPGERPLSRSAMGHNGAIAYLRTQGHDIQLATGLPMSRDDVALRILPLHDTDLFAEFVPPEDREAYLRTGTEYDITSFVVLEKIERAPTLLIAPKWTRAVRHSGFAHDSLLLPVADASDPFLSIGFLDADFIRPRVKLLEMQAALPSAPGASITLYEPQLFPITLPEGCTSLIGNSVGHLLVECVRDGITVRLLSDPDLMNNHGIGLGQNAMTTSALMSQLAGGGRILVDPTVLPFLNEGPTEVEARDWADLARFFTFPFSLLWAGAVLIFALALWRSSVRTSPPERPFDDEPGASKSVSIAAKARLLRLTGHDFPVFRAHMHARLHWLDQELHGKDMPTDDPLPRIQERLNRRNPEIAKSFVVAATAVETAPRNAPRHVLMSLASAFEDETAKVLDEFGRTSRPR